MLNILFNFFLNLSNSLKKRHFLPTFLSDLGYGYRCESKKIAIFAWMVPWNYAYSPFKPSSSPITAMKTPKNMIYLTYVSSSWSSLLWAFLISNIWRMNWIWLYNWVSEYSLYIIAFLHVLQTGYALWNSKGSRRVLPEQPGSSQTNHPW